MDITLGKMKISGAALLALAAVYFFDTSGIIRAVVVAVAVHELGHLAVLRCLGYRVAEFRVELLGLAIRCNKTMSYVHEIVISAAGPAASLLLAFASSLYGKQADNTDAFLLAGVSFVCGVFNLLPAMCLDGGKILYNVVALNAGLTTAEKVLAVTGCIVIGGMLTLGTAALIWSRGNFTPLAAGVWMLISYCKRNGLRIKSKGKNIGCVLK